MKKPLTAPSAKKKSKMVAGASVKSLALKNLSGRRKKGETDRNQNHQLKTELLEKIDHKFNTLYHRLDRLEDAVEEILDELRATEALLESETGPYEGQA